ncbi:hypothetical protein CEXT_320071 [Caerostris extrusa]|uniref:Uncharacterized protein n=1 Tax=Caerostris extrusa TaxID=172846 RepID=A0AAV4WYQ9_CAEEX|nr:hypothetical protein CEXT_320071 [Caerostris extrusa]
MPGLIKLSILTRKMKLNLKRSPRDPSPKKMKVSQQDTERGKKKDWKGFMAAIYTPSSKLLYRQKLKMQSIYSMHFGTRRFLPTQSSGEKNLSKVTMLLNLQNKKQRFTHHISFYSIEKKYLMSVAADDLFC